ncbi:hypothetical protein BT67DRAFT_446044 [Trichocladium antarcticum]|uniref:CFEM domain-containing protein n=1 Tax=Trichocladium antarcticum TaxID=1450529 RepID=A0AAN6UBQ6_9PEZI|nr:hypothetical protein BT67DRAFT_446044 [Trichocladium antarcticum]
MKIPAVFLSLSLVGAAVAAIPPCAQPCADSFMQGGIGDCGSNVKCICSNKQFLSEIACCIAPVCNAAEQTEAVNFASQLCKGAGVTDLPTAVSCTTSAAKTSSPATTAAVTTGAESAATTAPSSASSTESSNYGPRPTAAAGLGAIGGIMAAVALL